MAKALEGLCGYRRIVDDLVIYDKDPAQHVEHETTLQGEANLHQQGEVEVLSARHHLCWVQIVTERI